LKGIKLITGDRGDRGKLGKWLNAEEVIARKPSIEWQ